MVRLRFRFDGAASAFGGPENLWNRQGHVFHPAIFVIRSAGVCRLNPEMARRIAELGLKL